VRWLLVLLGALLAPGSADAATPPVAGECVEDAAAGTTRCLYRSAIPSAGLLAECRADGACRVGHYHGDLAAVTWLAPPPGLAVLPRPDVIWLASTLAHARFACGAGCTVSYFFDARRHRVSPPHWRVLAVDVQRQRLLVAEERRLVVRHMYSGRLVLSVERDWAPGPTAADAVTSARLLPDGRLVLDWLRGPERTPVSERISVPAIPER
jgi:hypothetical protein